MIICNKYKYLFLETPMTGSTSIRNELCKYYDGKPILHKHATFFEFKEIANGKEKDFFIFAGVRNPLDVCTSMYLKFLTNHDSAYTSENTLIKSGGWVSKRRIKIFKFVQIKEHKFIDFLKKWYDNILPYSGLMDVHKQYCNYIIRFERINEDFSNVLKILNIPQVRTLPHLNKTSKKRNYREYYDDDFIDLVIKIFGPYMLEWNYKLPKSLSNRLLNSIDLVSYKISKKINQIYLKQTRTGFLKNLHILKEYLI